MTADFGFFRCLIGFMGGMLIYEFYKNRGGYRLFKNSWCFILLFFGALTAMHFAIMDVLIVAFFPLILLCAAYNGTTLKRVLDWRVFQRLGDWSFSIYMVHTPIMITLILLQLKKNPDLLAAGKKIVTPNYTGNVIACIVVLVITLLLSAFTYRFIEIPARNYLNKVFKTKEPRITVESMEV
jgi:peptidoglycan/LPS O-acetylase OafA/YrhL